MDAQAAAPQVNFDANKVRALIARYLGLDAERVTDEAHFRNDFDLDSLDRLELLILIEEEFYVEFSDDAVNGIEVVGDLIRYIEINCLLGHLYAQALPAARPLLPGFGRLSAGRGLKKKAPHRQMRSQVEKEKPSRTATPVQHITGGLDSALGARNVWPRSPVGLRGFGDRPGPLATGKHTTRRYTHRTLVLFGRS
jgi:acyl carrier protein